MDNQQISSYLEGNMRVKRDVCLLRKLYSIVLMAQQLLGVKYAFVFSIYILFFRIGGSRRA